MSLTHSIVTKVSCAKKNIQNVSNLNFKYHKGGGYDHLCRARDEQVATGGFA